MWVYKQTEPHLYTVGFYAPDDTWYPDSDWSSSQDAADRVHYLNGGPAADEIATTRLAGPPKDQK